MATRSPQRRTVQVPLYVAILGPLATLLLGLWTTAIALDRNPLPFPDRDYQVFSASSAEALVPMEDLMQALGQRPRFRADSPNVQRTIFASGTIINQPDPRMLESLGPHGAGLGFGKWGLPLDVDNLLNTRANTFAFGNPFSVADGLQQTPMRPRSIRIGFDASF